MRRPHQSAPSWLPGRWSVRATTSGRACRMSRSSRVVRGCRRCAACSTRRRTDVLGYPDPHGALRARTALAAYVNRTRGTVAHADRMVLCSGYAQGLRLVCEVLRSRGVRRVAVEDPGHGGQRADIQAMGLGIRPVPVDSGGLCVDRLRGLDVGAVLVTPAHQFPTGVVLAAERRAALLEWAASRRAVIIEDDYDAEYRFDCEPIGALQGLAEGRCRLPRVRQQDAGAGPPDRLAVVAAGARGSGGARQAARRPRLADARSARLRRFPRTRRPRSAPEEGAPDLPTAPRCPDGGADVPPSRAERGGCGGRPAPHGEPAAGQ